MSQKVSKHAHVHNHVQVSLWWSIFFLGRTFVAAEPLRIYKRARRKGVKRAARRMTRKVQ